MATLLTTAVVSPIPSPRDSSNDLSSYYSASQGSGWSVSMDEDDDEEIQIMMAIVESSPLSATSHQEASKVLEEWQSDDSVLDNIFEAPVGAPTSTTPFLMDSVSAAAVSDNDEDDETLPEDIATLMEVDEEIGSKFLDEEVFGGGCNANAGPSQMVGVTSNYCPSPTGPVEEFNNGYRYDGSNLVDDDDDDHFLAPLLEEDDPEAIVMAMDSVLVEVITTQNINFDPNAPFDEKRYQLVHKKLAESMKKTQESRKCLTMKTPKTEKYSRSKTVSGVISSIEKSSKQLEKYLQSVQKAIA